MLVISKLRTYQLTKIFFESDKIGKLIIPQYFIPHVSKRNYLIIKTFNPTSIIVIAVKTKSRL